MVDLLKTKVGWHNHDIILNDQPINSPQILTKDSVTVFVNAIMYYKVRNRVNIHQGSLSQTS